MSTEGARVKMVGALPIDVMARVVGAYAWIEARLFETLGAFAADEPSPAAAVFFDTWSATHAWHAELLVEQLPRLAHLTPEAVIVPTGEAQAGAFARLAAVPDTAARLGSVVRVVLPRMLAGYRWHLERAAPVADANLARALQLIVLDEVQAMVRGEALLEQLEGPEATEATEVTGAAAGSASDAERDLLASLAATGPGPGLVPWPSDAPSAD